MTAPVDIQHLEKYVFGDRALLDEILTIFIEQASLLLGRFDASSDDESWRSTAHTLKGASRGVGAWAVGDLAEKAEELVGADRTAERRTIIDQLRGAGHAAIDFARDYRDRAI
jgi:HPt (histidine-containing phosphotransfer) domain-containing protein